MKAHGAVGIYGGSPCKCGYLPLEEEVLSAWAGFPCMGGPRMPQGARLADGDCSLTCDLCKDAYIPQLHVRCYELESDLESNKTTNRFEYSLRELWALDIPQLSPSSLRYQLEQELLSSGSTVSESTRLRDSRPDLCWNLVWYCRRLSLPNDSLLEHESSIPVTSIGFHESTVRASVYKQLSSAMLREYLQIPEPLTLFPSLVAHEIELVENILQDLDGTFSGIRRAILKAFPLISNDSVVERLGSVRWSVPRRLYVFLLTLVYFSGNTVLLERPDELSAALDKVIFRFIFLKIIILKHYKNAPYRNQGIYFDRLYATCINQALSPEDLALLGVTEHDMKVELPMKSALIIRTTMGFLI